MAPILDLEQMANNQQSEHRKRVTWADARSGDGLVHPTVLPRGRAHSERLNAPGKAPSRVCSSNSRLRLRPHAWAARRVRLRHSRSKRVLERQELGNLRAAYSLWDT